MNQTQDEAININDNYYITPIGSSIDNLQERITYNKAPTQNPPPSLMTSSPSLSTHLQMKQSNEDTDITTTTTHNK